MAMSTRFGRYNLLCVHNDAKTSKGTASGFLTGILYLAPASSSGRNVCQHATPGCIAACLNTAGRGGMSSVQAGRLRKTRLLFEDRREFERQLADDIRKLQRYAARHGLRPVVRLNGTSDLPWERMPFSMRVNATMRDYACVMDAFPDVQFYDYTKNPRRIPRIDRASLPDNYDLTFSRSESNWDWAVSVLHHGGRVATVFHGTIPGTWCGFPVVVGDETDLRFLDARGVWVGLTAKGRAKHDASGFVVHTDCKCSGQHWSE